MSQNQCDEIAWVSECIVIHELSSLKACRSNDEFIDIELRWAREKGWDLERKALIEAYSDAFEQWLAHDCDDGSPFDLERKLIAERFISWAKEVLS